ncbi:MAG: hypothetical protein WC996_00350 [Peptostreptococcales bacterium]
MIILLISSFILITILGIPELLKINQKKKTTVIYLGLMSLGVIMSLIQALEISIMNPSEVIQSIVDYALKR